ncbi:MAG: hypothetical protein U0Q03_15320 [Acidimicrobiales bacterium]
MTKIAPTAPARTVRFRLPLSRRLALVGAVAVLGLTACGNPDSSASGTTASTVPALAVIQVAGSTGGATGGAVPAAADSEASTKMMAMALTYEWAGQTVDLTSPAGSWFFPAGSAPTTEQIQAIAAAFGVTGDVTELGADMGGGWMIGPNDGTAPSITVSADALQSWWYSPAWAVDTKPVADCAYYPPGDPAADPTTAEMPVCEEAQPPAGVPTKAEAEAKARDLFAAVGLDPSQFEFESYADEWSASVTGYLTLEGVRTTVSVNVGFGENGTVTWAGGFLATPQRGGDYPRIGVDAAIQRLNDQSMAWMTGYGPMARDVAASSTGGVAVGAGTAGVAIDAATGGDVAPEASTAGEAATETTSDAAESYEPAPDETVPTDSVVIDPMPMPIDCTDPATSCVPSEPVVITLDGVTASLEQVWAADGTVWLLPGYAFSGPEGSLASVVAVEDQYLEQAEPETLPVDTVVPATDVAVPDTAVAVDPAPPASAAADFDQSSIIGLTVDEATKVATEAGWSVRVAREDGVDLAVTMDYVPTRLNVAVEAGVITEVRNVG